MISAIFFPTQIYFKVCWCITQLQICVSLMIIRMLHHVTKNWGEMVLLPFFCTLPNVSLSIKQKNTSTLISEARLKLLYSRLGVKVVKDSVTSPDFEKARKWFHYESGKSKVLQKQTIGLQCYPTIPQSVTILHDNWIDFNENKDVFKDLNEVPALDDWFPYEYIDAEFNNKLDNSLLQLWCCVMWRAGWLLTNRGHLRLIDDWIIQWKRYRYHRWWNLITLWVTFLTIKAPVITRSFLWRAEWLLTNRGHLRCIGDWIIQWRKHRYHQWWQLVAILVTSLAIKAPLITRSRLLPTLIVTCSTFWLLPIPFGRGMMNAIWVCGGVVCLLFFCWCPSKVERQLFGATTAVMFEFQYQE